MGKKKKKQIGEKSTPKKATEYELMLFSCNDAEKKIGAEYFEKIAILGLTKLIESGVNNDYALEGYNRILLVIGHLNKAWNSPVEEDVIETPVVWIPNKK